MKIIARIVMSHIIVGYLILFGIVAPYLSKGLETSQTKDWVIIFIWGGLYILSIFFMWIYLFHHWGIKEFENAAIKRIWFWVILLGGFLYFLGPLIYYIVVFEMGKGLKKGAKP